MSIATEDVSALRTIKMVMKTDGLTGDRRLKVRVDSESVLYALDFGDDLGDGQKIEDIEAPVIVTGTSEGLSFSQDRNDSEARVLLSASTAGDYTVRVRVKYGGQWRAAHVTVKAT